MVGFIYVMENSINGKLYVGYTKDPGHREYRHLSGRSNCPALRSAVNKYGPHNFDFILLEKCDSVLEMKRREVFWISKLNTTSPNGYNLTYGGEGLVATNEIKKKISDKLKGNTNSKGRVLSEEHKKKISESQKGIKHHFYGKIFTEKHRKNLRESATGRKHTKITKARMRTVKLGKNLTQETKDKISSAKLGVIFSDIHKQRISESIKRHWAERREV